MIIRITTKSLGSMDYHQTHFKGKETKWRKRDPLAGESWILGFSPAVWGSGLKEEGQASCWEH